MMDQSAQGLASLGRNGDSMLVHMSPEELQGLQGLAMAQGGSLTINPDTGLPEAFKIKNLFKAVLPIAAGFMFPSFGTQFMGGMFGKGVAAGALAGAGISALSGENPLLGALTGGLGGYGGAGLAGSAANVGKGAIANVADDVVAVPSLPAQGPGASGAMGFSPAGQAPLSFQAPAQGGLSLQSATPNAIKDVISTTTPLEIAGENFGTLLKNPLDVMKDYGYGNSAMLAGGPLLAGLEPSDLGYGPGNLYEDPDKGKYRGPQGQLNLSDRFDTGLRLVAEGGYIDGYAMGGTVQSGGVRDLYGTPDNPATMSSGLGGFGLGRLNDLASEQARSQAQTLGYAEGGDVGGDVGVEGGVVDESVPNPEGVVSKYTTVVDDKGVASRVRVPYQYEKIIIPGVPDFNTIPRIEYNPYTYAGAMRKPQGMAEGGDVSNYRQDQTALNLDRLPSINLNIVNKPSEDLKTSSTPPSAFGVPSMGRMGPVGMGGISSGFNSNPFFGMGGRGPVGMGGISSGFNSNPFFGMGGMGIMTRSAPIPRTPTSYALNLNSGKQEAQYARGGYLDGAGDGMSDSIPATIEGKQPARLADGEFVIPADVVSHIGNGSSKAGSKRLYAMLDKVRQARTGHTKQGKQIKAEKYLPA